MTALSAFTPLFAPLVTACTHLTPLQPRTGAGAPAPVPASATDREYFAANPLMVPVERVSPERVPDTFNEPRDNGGRLHRATDILAPEGTKIVAAASGILLRLSTNARGGVTIYEVDDDRRFLYYYAHLERYADHLTKGAHVSQGALLGYVGATGNADAEHPHLHFQAMRWEPSRRDYWNAAPVDVRPFFTLTGEEHRE